MLNSRLMSWEEMSDAADRDRSCAGQMARPCSRRWPVWIGISLVLISALATLHCSNTQCWSPSAAADLLSSSRGIRARIPTIPRREQPTPDSEPRATATEQRHPEPPSAGPLGPPPTASTSQSQLTLPSQVTGRSETTASPPSVAEESTPAASSLSTVAIDVARSLSSTAAAEPAWSFTADEVAQAPLSSTAIDLRQDLSSSTPPALAIVRADFESSGTVFETSSTAATLVKSQSSDHASAQTGTSALVLPGDVAPATFLPVAHLSSTASSQPKPSDAAVAVSSAPPSDPERTNESAASAHPATAAADPPLVKQPAASSATPEPPVIVPAAPVIPPVSSAVVAPSAPFPLPDPPASMGRFLLFTTYGRESNRFLLVLYAIQFALFTDRRLLLIPYGAVGLNGITELRDMYDLVALEKHMRAARLELSRAPLPDENLPHLMSWNDYLSSVLKLDLPPSECVSVHRFFCSSSELEHDRCAARSATCKSYRIPFNGANGTLTRLPIPKSLPQLQELPDGLLSLSGEAIWTNELLTMMNRSSSPEQAQPSFDQTTLLKSLYPDLHPTLMHRAGEVIQSLRHRAAGNDSAAVSSTPVLALHIRLGDMRGRLLDVETRVRMMLQQSMAWGLNPLSPAIFIATDSRDQSDHNFMLRSFPSAQIGFPAASALDSDPPVFAVLLDKAACIRADYFVGSVGSTYTIAINMLRSRMDKAAANQAMV